MSGSSGGMWPEILPYYAPVSSLSSAHPLCPAAVGLYRIGTNQDSSQPWQVANLAVFVPVIVPVRLKVVKMSVVVGGVTGGNIDVGVYDAQGNRMVAAGSTALAAINTWQEFDVTDTELAPGLYYIAQAQSGTTGTTRQGTFGHAECRSFGIRSMGSAFPLPATATYAALNSSVSRVISATAHTQVTT